MTAKYFPIFLTAVAVHGRAIQPATTEFLFRFCFFFLRQGMHSLFLIQLPAQLFAMERSTVVGHRKWPGIGDNPSVFARALWWLVRIGGVVWGGVTAPCHPTHHHHAHYPSTHHTWIMNNPWPLPMPYNCAPCFGTQLVCLHGKSYQFFFLFFYSLPVYLIQQWNLFQTSMSTMRNPEKFGELIARLKISA